MSAMKMASPAASGSAPPDPVRALQHTLYRTAKMDAGRRFHALGDKVIRSDVLMRAWFQVYRNQGCIWYRPHHRGPGQGVRGDPPTR